MQVRMLRSTMLVVLLACTTAAAGEGGESDMVPYTIDWTKAGESVVDMSGYLDPPAGKGGFVKVDGEHLVRPDGTRLRIWGINVCGPNAFPPKDVAATVADDLARCGINAVRFHHLDSRWSPLLDKSRKDTQHFDPDALDRLDFFVAELVRRGIWSNLNLNVGRRFTAADGVRDAEYLGYGKSATYFNPRLVELQHDYARRLLTHRNPYTGNEYRREPAVVTVELVNENSVLEGWVNGRLVGKNVEKPGTWTPIPVSYAEELTGQYNAWLREHVPAADLAAIRKEVGADRVPRLKPDRFAKASALRFRTEARFYIHLEETFFRGMRHLLKEELGVRPPVVGTADHSDRTCAYAHVRSNLILDYVDGHGYWQHPHTHGEFRIRNTPMANDPLDSTVVQFARTPVVGRPYTISETNHPYPAEWASEGIPVLTAYALFHDWDGIYWFTWGAGRLRPRKRTYRRYFEISNDPVKMTHLAACAPLWHRKDLASAKRCIVRTYTETEMIEGLRMDRKERPFFDPAFPRSVPLVHATRWTPDGEATPYPDAAPLGKIEADTGQLGWYGADAKQGRVVVDSPHTQALVGFVGKASRTPANLAADIDTPFATVYLTSLDGEPIESAGRLLLTATATAAHTGFEWNPDRKTVKQWGRFPTVIEPVRGTVTLTGLKGEGSVTYQPLTAEGRPLGDPLPAEDTNLGPRLRLGTPPATWYRVEVK